MAVRGPGSILGQLELRAYKTSGRNNPLSLMRGIHAINGAVGPQFVCPSCARRLIVGETPASAASATRCTSERGISIVATVSQKRVIETAARLADNNWGQQQAGASETTDEQIPSQKRGLFGFRRWNPPQPSMSGPPKKIQMARRKAKDSKPVVDLPSRPEAGTLPLFEKRRLASLRRSDLISLLGEFSSSTNEDIFELFEEGNPDMVMHAFLGPEKYRKLAYGLPGPAFAEAFRMLSPSFFVEPYKRIHRYFHPSVVSGKGFRSLETAFNDFERMLFQVVQLREEAGHEIGLAEFTHLLYCARTMGNRNMAEDVWYEIHARGLEPTTECYNHLMAAMIWDKAFFDKEKFNVRVTEWNMKKRRYRPANKNYRGYKSGPDGLRRQIISLFDRMIINGFPPDEDTFINVMTASARVGDIDNVKKIMMGVWNVDVDALVKYGEGPKVPPVRSFSTTSPLHPSDKLFFAVAHIFGSNNDFPTALQLVDYLSRQYSIFIDRTAWQELLEWSFVLSLRRFHERAEENSVGLIPRAIVKDIYSTMTMPPYNTRPNMVMVNIMVKQSFIRNVLDDTLSYIRDGYRLFLASLKKRNRLQRTLIRQQLSVAPMPTKQEKERWRLRELDYLQHLSREWNDLRKNVASDGLEKGEGEGDGECFNELVDNIEADISNVGGDEASASETGINKPAWAAPSARSPAAEETVSKGAGPILTVNHDSTAATTTTTSISEQQTNKQTSPGIREQATEPMSRDQDQHLQEQSQEREREIKGRDEQQQLGSTGMRNTAAASIAADNADTGRPTTLRISIGDGSGGGGSGSVADISATSTATAIAATGPVIADEAASLSSSTSAETNAVRETVRDRIRRILELYHRERKLPQVVNPVKGIGFDLVFENLMSGSRSVLAEADLRASEARKLARKERANAAAAAAAAAPGSGVKTGHNSSAASFPLPYHLPTYGTELTGQEETPTFQGTPERSRFDAEYLHITSYNNLLSQSRSSLTHPETPRPDHISLYHTEHLTLRKIKAFRHLQAVVHLAQRELARDVTLIERWVRLLLIGHRWVHRTVSAEWESRRLPRFIEQWRPFMGRNPTYFVKAGKVVLEEKGFWRGGSRIRVEGGYHVAGEEGKEVLVPKVEKDWVVKDTFDVIGHWKK
ncbi:hypothetical protein KEM54_001900 [Ascosphaera aggregata]|nr:hypothetical protein KEM54_001900 [Ascosphaera aggregata]